MRKALVFVSAFALVLVAGAAVAFMASPGEDAASTPLAAEEPTTTSTSVKEKEDPPPKEEVKEEETQKEDPPKEEEKKEEPKDEEVKDEEKDTTPPAIEILFPENGQHFSEQKVAFEGKTEPGARVFAGDYEADVDAEGNWRIVLILTNPGGNLATFKAIDEAGNKATASVKAYYDAPEKEEPKEKDFTVNQKYGTCSEPEPYDKWYGTGTPGMKIWIGNKYGSASTKVNEKGEWYLKVHFPEASCNEWIDVVLETSEGHRKVFDFKRICEEGGEGGHDK